MNIIKRFSLDSIYGCIRTSVVLALLLISILPVRAQNSKSVQGVVYDSDNVSVIGANIMIKGTTIGTITDFDGHFVINVPNPSKAILVVSYIGYKTLNISVKGRSNIKITLQEDANTLGEVTVVAYGVQKKETLTGAISSVKTDQLLQSPNASIANSLAGKITGLSSVQSSGQPGAEDPKIYIRGVGSLTEGASSPLILVDGVERSFYQMDPNEIASVSVLKDASATAVFGVRGANGVILVTTKRGKEGKAKISISSSVGVQQPTRTLKMADSYTFAMIHNEQQANDGRDPFFDDYTLERFRTGDSPILYPNISWRKYLTKPMAIQTQHNLNVSGGTKDFKYFVSMGYLFQDGLFKKFGMGNKSGYNYNRYNYRANLDINVTKSTKLAFGIGGILGDKVEPADSSLWGSINWSQPFSSPGLVDGKPLVTDAKFGDIKMENPFSRYYNRGYVTKVNNSMNLDLKLTQDLDFITKGLKIDVKGAYNTTYYHKKRRTSDVESYTPFYKSNLEDPTLSMMDPNFNKSIVYRINGKNTKLGLAESTGRGRNWYMEGSLRYNRKFGEHHVSGLLLYNQSKKYYPSQFVDVPTSYVGFVGRATYNYKSRYMAEFNIGYNGSENFAPGKRFGTFPAISAGYILSEEPFIKNLHIFDYLKIRASVGLVGNDNIGNNRFLYLPDSYSVDRVGKDKRWRTDMYGYNFGYDISTLVKGAMEKGIGNPDVTWETALKQNYGIDMYFLNNRLKLGVDFFWEDRNDILIKRNTIPYFTSLSKSILPVVNMGQVKNHGYEIQAKWNDNIGENISYWIDANMSYSKNKIIYQDEIEPNESYMWRTGHSVGAIYGRVFDRFYSAEDFTDPSNGILNEKIPDPGMSVRPGDVKYKDLNSDMAINTDDECEIGYSKRPVYTFGLNLGASFKQFFFSMNWVGTKDRSLLLSDEFRKPFMGENRSLMSYQLDSRWTSETAATAKYPRISSNSITNNYWTSDLWIKDGSYIKLKNLTFGYNFKPSEKLKRWGIQKLGIKLTGYNLLIFDKFKLMDPESNPNRYGDTYPVVKIYNLGLNVTF